MQSGAPGYCSQVHLDIAVRSTWILQSSDIAGESIALQGQSVHLTRVQDENVQCNSVFSVMFLVMYSAAYRAVQCTVYSVVQCIVVHYCVQCSVCRMSS